jgi:hypothetical protein
MWLLKRTQSENHLSYTKHRRCTNQRDRVYALLSVATTGHEGFYADYTVRVNGLLYRVVHNMCKNKQPKTREEAIARFLDVAEVFRADLTSLAGLEGLLKDHMKIPVFVPLTRRSFGESLAEAQRKKLRYK